MSSGSAAFKAAAVAAVLALLVLPSFGRCPSLGPAPPPPAPALAPVPVPVTPPAPAPVPAPPVSCSDCRASLVPACQSKCSASVAAACRSFCDPPPGCDECRSRASNCTACCDAGTCSCDCKTTGDYNCRGACYVQYTGCRDCQSNGMNQCMADCLSDCDATCQPA